MLNGPLFSGIISYTIPIILTSLLQLLFNAADMMIVGQFCGSITVAAVGATGSLITLIINLFMGLSVGVGVCVARAIGCRDEDNISKTVHTAIPASVLCGVFLTVFGVLFSRRFLQMMDTPVNVLPLATLYMQIYFGGIIFNMVYNFGAAILRSAGDTKTPLTFLTIAGVINVVLNLLFVIVFHMDVDGVALATVISQGFSAVMVIIALMKRTDACKLHLRQMRIFRKQLVSIIRIGVPTGIQYMLFSISNVLIQSSVNSLGDVFLSGSSAAGNLEGFVYFLMNAFSQTAMNFIGQNHSAHNFKRVEKVHTICLICTAAVGLVAGVLCYAFSPYLLSLYIVDSQQAIAYGITRLSMICLPYFLCGMMEVSSAGLRGMGVAAAPTFISVLGVCGFRLFWIYTVFQIPEFHTPQCLFLSYPLSWIITFSITIVVFYSVFKKYSNIYKNEAV